MRCTLHKTSKEHCWVEETTDEAAKRVVVESWASQSLCIEDNSIAVDQHHHLLFQEGRRNSSQMSESSQTAKVAASKTYQTLGRSFSWPKPISVCVWQQNKTKPGLAAATAQWNKLRKIPLICIPFFLLHLLLLFSQDITLVSNKPYQVFFDLGKKQSPYHISRNRGYHVSHDDDGSERRARTSVLPSQNQSRSFFLQLSDW